MKIYEFITESNWCKKDLCQDNYGLACHWPLGDKICRWCLAGMVVKLYSKGDDHLRILSKIREKIGMPVHTWNDRPERKWTDVRDLCKELDI